MPIETIEFKNESYPKFQAEGFASQFAFPFANHFCKGIGYDIGCSKKEWAYKGAIPIDIAFNDNPQADTDIYNANLLPDEKVDYIFSSHCLEHVGDYISTVLYWLDHLVSGGVLFMYLPDFSQKYWRNWHNRKHKHNFTPDMFIDFIEDLGLKGVVSGVDLNNSFYVVIEKGA